MALATSSKRYLEQTGISFHTHPHLKNPCLSVVSEELAIDSSQIAVAKVIRSEKNSYLMVVYPLSHELDYDRLNGMLRRDFSEATECELSVWFKDVEPGAYPPLPQPYGLPCIVDRELLGKDRVYFRAGTHCSLVSVSGDDYGYLMGSVSKAIISNYCSVESESNSQELDSAAIKQQLEKLYRLPPMPAMAYKIIEMVNDPDVNAKQLSSVIELDPSVTSQVIRYACSPYYGYQGKIDSVQSAVTRVLGFDLVCNLALGIASSQAFSIPKDGPLGLRNFWRHSLYNAILSQTIAKKLAGRLDINPDKAYLCGLLHNIGVLLIGHLFPPEFKMLNKLVAQHADCSLHELEKQVIGMGQAKQIIELGHDQIGSWLLERWQLPGEVVACCAEHNNVQVSGEYSDYVRIIQTSNYLLAQEGISDIKLNENMGPVPLATALVNDAELYEIYEQVMSLCGEIDELANQIAA
ncbi:MAG: HDOD domain-containing protein [Pseudomonadales bacterium]|nr:HDOD domain-containing protein [Pseudomonadales bacterium]